MHPLVFHPRPTTKNEFEKFEQPLRLEAGKPASDKTLPFDIRVLNDGTLVGISVSGEHLFLEQSEVDALLTDPSGLPPRRRADMAARFFLPNHGRNVGKERLLAARRAAKHETVTSGPSLHIIVPTLQCGHTCQYCQVSRAQTDAGFSMSPAMLDAACDRVWESNADDLTVEFQGGDPLVRFDLIVRAVDKLTQLNHEGRRRIRFVVASTLHQLTQEMCEYFRIKGVVLSTSLDGPEHLHNRNRPVPGRDSFRRTVEGIRLARQHIGEHAVSALMTTTRASLGYPEEIVDEYVRQGFPEIFLRPLSVYGFAKRNLTRIGYSREEFQRFYDRALARIMWWNGRGVALREVYMSVVMNKLLSTFDAGYVDLQSESGTGASVLVYNYDGWVYPSDEARMLVETGDTGLRMGRVTDSLEHLLSCSTGQRMRQASEAAAVDCIACAYRHYCAPNPVDSQAQFGRPDVPAHETEHCLRHQWLFDTAFTLLHEATPDMEETFHDRARPNAMVEASCDR